MTSERSEQTCLPFLFLKRKKNADDQRSPVGTCPRYDIVDIGVTSHRRQCDVVTTSYACWKYIGKTYGQKSELRVHIVHEWRPNHYCGLNNSLGHCSSLDTLFGKIKGRKSSLALGTRVRQRLFKWWHWVDLDLFTARSHMEKMLEHKISWNFLKIST